MKICIGTYRSDSRRSVSSYDAFLDAIQIEYCNLRVVNNGSPKHGAKDARVARREITTLKGVYYQLAIASLKGNYVSMCIDSSVKFVIPVAY